jgi:serine/threonine protein kinase
LPGGFGVVISALDTISGESVAIKRIPLSNVRSEDLDSVLDELRLLQRLSHPNIVQVRPGAAMFARPTAVRWRLLPLTWVPSSWRRAPNPAPQYKDSIRTSQYLYIVVELAEGGAAPPVLLHRYALQRVSGSNTPDFARRPTPPLAP